jgi:hypothetical protein
VPRRVKQQHRYRHRQQVSVRHGASRLTFG